MVYFSALRSCTAYGGSHNINIRAPINARLLWILAWVYLITIEALACSIISNINTGKYQYDMTFFGILATFIVSYRGLLFSCCAILLAMNQKNGFHGFHLVGTHRKIMPVNHTQNLTTI